MVAAGNQCRRIDADRQRLAGLDQAGEDDRGLAVAEVGASMDYPRLDETVAWVERQFLAVRKEFDRRLAVGGGGAVDWASRGSRFSSIIALLEQLVSLKSRAHFG